MKHDSKILNQLVALKLHSLAGTTPNFDLPDGYAGAMDALGVKDDDLRAIGASRAWNLAWDFAIEAVACTLDYPVCDGSELREVVANIRDRFDEEVELESEERQFEGRRRRARPSEKTAAVT